MGEGEGVNEEGEIVSIETVETEEEDEDVEAECKIIGVMGSMGEFHTMKIDGKIASIEVVVLIDSGASHNFISPEITTALGLQITPMAAKTIRLGDGHKVLSKGLCEGVRISLGSQTFVVDALVLELCMLVCVYFCFSHVLCLSLSDTKYRHLNRNSKTGLSCAASAAACVYG